MMLSLFLSVVEAIPAPEIIWHIGPNMPRPSGGHAAVVLGGDLFVIGGTNWHDGKKHWFDEVWCYDVQMEHWSLVDRLPTPLAYGATANASERLYVCGGADGAVTLRSCILLERREGDPGLRCRALPPLPEPRSYAGVALVGDTLYVFGGAMDFADLSTIRDTVLTLDLDDPRGHWREVSQLPSSRCHAAIAAAGQNIYVFGGCVLSREGELLNLRDCWGYDVVRGTWQRLCDLPFAARGLEALPLNDDCILLFGGYSATAIEAQTNGPTFGFRDEVLAFQPSTGRFMTLVHMSYGAVGMAPVMDGHYIYLTGGEHRLRSRLSTLTIGSVVWGTQGFGKSLLGESTLF
ncbi:MAG: Kelch repeat-containing protein [Candidatus Zipacnadales bacterium]